MDGKEFPASLGSYATIRKSNSGGPIDRRKYKYLDGVHMDIAIGDCLSVGSFQYALILVDHATQYNWAFGLKNLSSDAILDTIWLFCAAAGSLTQCYYCDCDLKLFGTAISKYLIDNNSKVVVVPTKRQLSNNLIESHWKIMVHMGRAYLTKKQMPRTFWFYAIVHSARMMNAIPGTFPVTFLHHSSLSMALATMNAHGFLCFPSVTSITKRTATNNAPSTKPKPWMVL
jgi:hypothetical protein